MAKFNLDTNRKIEVKKNLPYTIASNLPPEIKEENSRRIFFMQQALILAKEAAKNGDVPVGCVIVRHNEIIAASCNSREKTKCATRHAELSAIEDACLALGGWRLVACEMFVTLEPCPMCAGAIMNARIPKLYIGASEQKSGAYGGLFDLNSFPVNHKPETVFGILSNECAKVIKDFFAKKR